MTPRRLIAPVPVPQEQPVNPGEADGSETVQELPVPEVHVALSKLLPPPRQDAARKRREEGAGFARY